MKRVFLMLISTAIIFGSCEKEDLVNNQEINSDFKIPLNSNIAKVETSIYENIENEGLQKIADLHNVILRDAVSNYNKDGSIESLKDAFLNTKYYKQVVVNYPEIDLGLKGDYEGTLKFYLSENSYTFLEKANNVLRNNLNSFTNFSNSLKLLEDEINENIENEIERKTLILYTKTLMNSSYFWLPKENGFGGKGYNYAIEFSDEPDFISIIGADALGAAGAFIGGAFVTAATGGSGIGIFYMVGWASAWASGTNGLLIVHRPHVLPR